MKNKTKRTPDILADLMMSNMASQKEDNKTIKPASNKTLKQEIKIEPLKQASQNEIKPVVSKASSMESNKTLMEESKEKATFNLSNNLLQNLDDAWITLRRSKLKDNQRITKTLIVEAAIKIALNEFEDKGELSQLYRSLKD